jgi:Clr5 domain
MAATVRRLALSGRQEDQTGSQDCPTSTMVDWERFRLEIETLYCEKDYPLREVMRAIRKRYHMEAT